MKPSDRANALFVVRESDAHDRVLFNAMRKQTYLAHRNVPGASALVDAELPRSDDADWLEVPLASGDVEQVRLQRLAPRTWLFTSGGSWHLWSMSSAAKENDTGENAFTKILIDQLQSARPLNVYAANFARVVRSGRAGRELQTAVEDNVDVFHAGGMKLRFGGDNDERNSAKLQFTMLTQVAAWERDSIVQRMLAGRIARWHKRQWPFGRRVCPVGYRLDDTDRLVPDPSVKAQVRNMMLILSRDLPPTEAVRQLDEAGVKSNQRTSSGEPWAFADRKNPGALLASLYGWAPLYAHGEYLFRVRNEFRGFKELNGVKVVRYEDDLDDLGEFQMLYKPGVPSRGWADPGVVEAFVQAAIGAANSYSRRKSPRPLGEQALAESEEPTIHGLIASRQLKQRVEPSQSREIISLFSGQSWGGEADERYHLAAFGGPYEIKRAVKTTDPGSSEQAAKPDPRLGDDDDADTGFADIDLEEEFDVLADEIEDFPQA